jgi:hypothetical protein
VVCDVLCVVRGVGCRLVCVLGCIVLFYIAYCVDPGCCVSCVACYVVCFVCLYVLFCVISSWR